MYTFCKPTHQRGLLLVLALCAASLFGLVPPRAAWAGFASGTTSTLPSAIAVATFAPGCATAQTAFVAGGTLCAQVTGIDPAVTNARFDLVDPDGIIQQTGPSITADGQTATYVLPSSGPLAKTGTWRVNIAYNTDSSVAATATFTLLVCPTVTLSPATLPNGVAGVAYSQSVTASPGGGSYSYAVSSGALPTGLALNAATGAITGTPSVAGSYAFVITATVFGSCQGTQAYSLSITCPTLTFSPASLPGGALGTAYNQTVAASPAGGNYSYAVTTGALPPGLSLNAATGALTGTPSAGGSYAFGLTATGFGICSGSQSYSLLITATCGTITLSPASLPAGSQGTAYSQTLSATGGVAPYTYNVLSGALPGGLTLDANSGVLSGSPAGTGTFAFTIRATGQGGCTGQRSYLLTINCATVTIDTALPNPVKSVAYSQTLTASPAGAYTFNILIGGLPPGLTLSSAGVLSGVVSTSGTYTFTVRARTVSGCQGTRAYTLTIS